MPDSLVVNQRHHTAGRNYTYYKVMLDTTRSSPSTLARLAWTKLRTERPEFREGHNYGWHSCDIQEKWVLLGVRRRGRGEL